MPLDRDAASADALLTDLYLDALLAGAVLDHVLDQPAGPRLEPATIRAAERLRRDLVRVHPSFRFEERLATRLAETALGLRVPLAVGGDVRVVLFRSSTAPANDDGDVVTPLGSDPGGDRSGIVRDDHGIINLDPGARRERTRPLLIGGALTSAAISIAGAAFVAWRYGRPGRSATPMARAARAVREARLAAATALPSIDPPTIRRRPD